MTPFPDRTDLLADAAARAAVYLRTSRGRPVAPHRAAVAALAGFPSALPEDGTGPEAVLELLDRLGSPATVLSNAGRYFGFVTGGTDPAAQAAGILAGAWDQNAALPVMSPAAAHLDALAARWCCELLDLPATVVATFCGGATIANLTCILAARDTLLHRIGWSVERNGLNGAPRLRVVTGAEVHISVLKALRAAGFGTDAVTLVPTDDHGRVMADAVPEPDDRTLLVLQAGNVNTGHSDPFQALIPAARAGGAWVHVDGAFGLWAAASPRHRAQVAGAGDADSWATDAHKWLNVPYDCGIAACAREEDMRRALATDAAYLGTGEGRAPMHLSLQMSQRARGVEVWAALSHLGRRGVAELVARCCDHARRLADLLAAEGVPILAPVALNQVLAGFGDDSRTDAVIDAVQRDGACWVGPTTWRGRRAMRLSVSDAATTEGDIAAAAAAIVRCRDALG